MNGDAKDRGPIGAPGSDEEVFAGWYRRHHDQVLARCVRLLGDRAAAEDVAQETLLRAWLGRERMREEDLSAWLTVVARNLCISHIRRRKRAVPTEVLPERPDEAADPARIVERLESGRALRRAMARIGDSHRVLLFRREIEGAKYEELGAELGLSDEGVRSIAFRARRALRQHLEAVGEGFAGVLVAMRLRARSAITRARTSAGYVESGFSSLAQSGLNAMLALAVALGGSGGAALLEARQAAPVASRARLAVVAPGAPASTTAHAPGGATVSSSSRAPKPHRSVIGGPMVPGVGGHVWNPPDHTNDLILHVAGHEVEVVGGGDKGDGLGAVYWVIDQGVLLACAVSTNVCSVFTGP